MTQPPTTISNPYRWADGPVGAGLAILVGNVVAAWGFFGGWWTLGQLLALFWTQSVIIGLCNAVRMASLRQFCTKGFTSGGKRVAEDASGKRSTVLFFLFHYGFFHAIYAVFLVVDRVEFGELGSTWWFVSLASITFGELLALLRHIRLDRTWKPNLGAMMFYPYLRIIPMHLTIIFGGIASSFGAADKAVGVIFLPLKTLADLGMFAVEAAWDKKRLETAEPS